MPLFEYRCAACEARFEWLTSTAATGDVTCRACGSPDVARLVSTFSVGKTTHRSTAVAEPGPCGACGAPQRGTCGEG